MPRKPRFYLPGAPVHVVQRGNNRQAIFFGDNDYLAYQTWLKEGSERYRCAIHAYVLMTNHVHLLVTPTSEDAISRMMQYTGRRYVPYVNAQYNRSGTLWEGRYKASLIKAGSHLLTCMRYIELNPVRADMVEHPRAYRWSSHPATAYGKKDPLVKLHPLYIALDRDPVARRRAYRDLFKHHIGEQQLADLRAAWRTGTPLGNDRFRNDIERATGIKVGFNQRGRPKKESGNGNGL